LLKSTRRKFAERYALRGVRVRGNTDSVNRMLFLVAKTTNEEHRRAMLARRGAALEQALAGSGAR